MVTEAATRPSPLHTMTTSRLTTTLAILLAFPAFGPAQEANPFDKSKGKPAPARENPDLEATSTEHHAPTTFAKLTETILVQADVLNAWMEENPPQAEAAKLRDAVQGWIADGKATPDHTSLSFGNIGKESMTVSARNLSYPTEFTTAPGATAASWPHPLAWETTALGYTLVDSWESDGNEKVKSTCDYKWNSLGQAFNSFNQLLEQTHRPGDILNPSFRAQQFISATTAGKPALLLRADEPLNPASEGTKPNPRRARLVFSQTEPQAAGAPRQASKPAGEPCLVSTKLVRVDHRTYSDWLRKTGLRSASATAWPATGGWIKSGSAKVTDELSGSMRRLGEETRLHSVEDVYYPAEWELSNSTPAKDSSSLPEMNFSLPGALERGQNGLTLQLTPEKGEGASSEIQLTYAFSRSQLAGKMVYSRIHQHGQWVPDATMPVFATNKWEGVLRLERGVWTLVGSGSDFDEKGELDPNHAVLAFLRID